MLQNKNADLFDEYIEYSLREEKRLLNKINQNIANRGYELPIENRMKHSIGRAFTTSSFLPEKVHEENKEPWGETIYKRAKSIGMEEEYFAIFSLPSHAVHGNWQDLITHHLEYKNNEFSPRTDWTSPLPQYLFTSAFLCAETNKLYLNEILEECGEKKQINDLLDDIIIRIRVSDELHEQFLQSRDTKK